MRAFFSCQTTAKIVTAAFTSWSSSKTMSCKGTHTSQSNIIFSQSLVPAQWSAWGTDRSTICLFSFNIMSSSPHYEHNCEDIKHSGPLLPLHKVFFLFWKGGRARRLRLGNVASFFGDADESGALDVFS